MKAAWEAKSTTVRSLAGGKQSFENYAPWISKHFFLAKSIF